MLTLKDNEETVEDYAIALQLVIRAPVSIQLKSKSQNSSCPPRIFSKLVESLPYGQSGVAYISMTSKFSVKEIDQKLNPLL